MAVKRDSAGRVKKGSKLNPKGRSVGTANKITTDIRAAVLAAANHAGNVVKTDFKDVAGMEHIAEMDGAEAYLTVMALQDRKLFAPLLAKVMPVNVDMKLKVEQDELVRTITERRQQVIEHLKDVTPAAEKLKEALNHEDT